MKILSITNIRDFQNIAQALSIDTRIQILELLQDKKLNVNEIASSLNIPVSTATVNIKKLEEAGLIESELLTGIRGAQKVCSLKYERVVLDIKAPVSDDNVLTISMPIGQFVHCEVEPTCGIVTESGPLGLYDDKRSFYLTERLQAQLIWFKTGYLEYHFPNILPPGTTPKDLQFIAEVCSEAPYYKNNWPSDITVWINGTEIGTWTSPGDFGGRRGLLTPKWWGIYKTQFGLLKNWKVNHEGSFIDGVKLSDVTLKDLKLDEMPYISVEIGVREDAKNPGGLNLFGKHFGNYEEDLLLLFEYE